MSVFSEKYYEAIRTGKFYCAKCKALMRFVDKWEDKLICPKCGYIVETQFYGFETEEEFKAAYPTLEELLEAENKKKGKKTK
jgi:DNA-directed RNA polymerase subunit M/transcription elongation factor TFIIS